MVLALAGLGKKLFSHIKREHTYYKVKLHGTLRLK
jgi:hypothetical protein